MRSIVVDKIASVTQACGLSQEVRISNEIPAEEGVVVVVEVLNNKSSYNTLELTSGRMAKVLKGDIVVGALGHRKALFGYSGHVPPTVKPGAVRISGMGAVPYSLDVEAMRAMPKSRSLAPPAVTTTLAGFTSR